MIVCDCPYMELLKCGMTPLTGLNFSFKSICQHLDYFSTHRSSFVVWKVHACAEFWTLSLSKKQKTPETNIFYIGIENFHNGEIGDDWPRAESSGGWDIEWI